VKSYERIKEYLIIRQISNLIISIQITDYFLTLPNDARESYAVLFVTQDLILAACNA
jgi:hypothetical protein